MRRPANEPAPYLARLGLPRSQLQLDLSNCIGARGPSYIELRFTRKTKHPNARETE